MNMEGVRNLLEILKPAASKRSRILAAALLWSSVGISLATWGGRNLLGPSIRLNPIWLVPIGAVGILKGRLVLDRAAEKILARIQTRGDGKCLFGFFSVRNWGMVLMMMLFGRILRHSSAPGLIVWGIYFAIGTGLTFSSRLFWRRWSSA